MAGAALLVLAGCSSGDTFSSPAPAPSTTTTVPATLAPPAEVTVRGVVAQALASARVVVLAQPVAGFANVALTADTELVRAGGAPATITDLVTGASIEATGRAGTANTLVARRVVLL